MLTCWCYFWRRAVLPNPGTASRRRRRRRCHPTPGPTPGHLVRRVHIHRLHQAPVPAPRAPLFMGSITRMALYSGIDSGFDHFSQIPQPPPRPRHTPRGMLFDPCLRCGHCSSHADCCLRLHSMHMHCSTYIIRSTRSPHRPRRRVAGLVAHSDHKSRRAAAAASPPTAGWRCGSRGRPNAS